MGRTKQTSRKTPQQLEEERKREEAERCSQAEAGAKESKACENPEESEGSQKKRGDFHSFSLL